MTKLQFPRSFIFLFELLFKFEMWHICTLFFADQVLKDDNRLLFKFLATVRLERILSFKGNEKLLLYARVILDVFGYPKICSNCCWESSANTKVLQKRTIQMRIFESCSTESLHILAGQITSCNSCSLAIPVLRLLPGIYIWTNLKKSLFWTLCFFFRSFLYLWWANQLIAWKNVYILWDIRFFQYLYLGGQTHYKVNCVFKVVAKLWRIVITKKKG